MATTPETRRPWTLPRSAPWILGLLFLLLPGAGAPAEPPLVRRPDPDLGAKALSTRAQAQRQTVGRFQVDYDFQFEDRIAESGITFVHESVDDALESWMPVHYDHGNGVAVADVDGDSLYDLYFTSQLGGNELWRNLGGGRFEDITKKAGVGLDDDIGVAASFADYDNDGDPDLYVTSVRTGNTLFENDGTGRFRDVTRRAGLEYSGHSSGAVFFDYDNDGWLDLYVTNVGVYTIDEKGRGGFYRGIDNAFKGHVYPERTEHGILYHSLGDGTFEDVSADLGLQDGSWSGDATFADLNRDLYPDLYVLNMQGDDHYYENRAGTAFVDRTAELFPKTSWGAMGVKFFDYNNDGREDLFVTDMHSDMHDQPVDPMLGEKTKIFAPGLVDSDDNILGNSFYEGREDGSFEEISDLIGVENYWPWGLSVGDLNADGWDDLFIASSMNYPFRYGINSVLLNNRGTGFLDSEFLVGVEPRRENRTAKPLFDLDCDGEDGGHQLCKDRTGVIRVVGALGSRSSALFDLDGDGDLDIVTNEFNDPPQVLVSDLSERRQPRYLAIRLVGGRSNRDGLGARVRVRTDGGDLIRYHDGKSGYLSQSSLPLYIGLGEKRQVEGIEVTWPSGRVQDWAGEIGPNRVIEIVEDAETPGAES